MSRDFNMRFLQPRRWAVNGRRLNAEEQISELDISHDEAKTAILACLPQIGNTLLEIKECDPAREKYQINMIDHDGEVMDYTIPAETIDHIVRALRIMCGGDGTTRMPRLRDGARVIPLQEE